MANEVLVSPLLNLVSENISSMIRQENSLMPSVNKELGKLSHTISMIKELVGDAELKQSTDRGLQIWLKELKEVAYDADDILDEYARRLRVEGRGSNHRSQVCNFFSPCLCIKKVAIGCDILHKIKKIRKMLQEIAEESSKFGLHSSVLESRQRQVEIRKTTPLVDESMVLGREAEKENILELLLSSKYDVGVGVCVIPIVGPGGIGKTTLAQCVFHDERVERNFELKIWVCVSTNFDLRRILREIIESATLNTLEFHGLDSLERCLLETLKEKRYLLVLDDVWNENEEQWERLRDVLGCGATGSRIIVTTRSERVTLIMSTVDPICLQGLSEKDCWSLFMRIAIFRDGHERMPLMLVAIGKEMVRKCEGIPLAVKILGSLMYFKRDEAEWLSILESGAMGILEDEYSNILNSFFIGKKFNIRNSFFSDEKIINIQNLLRLSYNHLPLYLKSCIMFCSIFPKYYKFEKDTLIRIWMAEGFIQPSRRGVQMEDVGCEYFNELLSRSFFQSVEKDVDGNIITYKMHDFLHELAQSIAEDECQMIDFDTSRFMSYKVRHSSLVYDDTVHTTTLQRLYKCKKLRTILNFGEGGMIEESLNSLFLNFRCLRVLDLGRCEIAVLPNSIGNLKYLRYLNISGNHFRTLPNSIGNLKLLIYLNISGKYCKKLPESICSLWNLQTLKIQHCVSLSKLPKGVKNLINLRHLEIDGDNQLTYMPTGIGKLTRLQTLGIFSVGKESGAGIGELQDLNLLRRNLEIRNLDNIRNIKYAKKARLKNKEYLRFLVFRWSDCYEVSSEEEQAIVEAVFEALQPHTNLQRLCIKDYKGDNFPSWMGDSSFTNLARVDLYNCKRSKRLPPLGQLKSLKHLTISGADGVKYLNDEINGDGNVTRFPSLGFLVLRKMPSLEELVRNGEGEMNSLLTLEIESCPKLRAFPHLPLLEFLELRDMPDLENLLRDCREMPSLRRLKIASSSKLIALPQLPLLEFLELRDILDLEVLVRNHEGEMPSLRSLKIESCPKLRLLPHLPSLLRLQILNHCKLMSSSEGLLHLTSLKTLELSGCDEIAVTLEHHPSLETLLISDCPHLTSLPDGLLQDLAVLRSFEIRHCPKLTYLPERLDNLIALRSLSFIGCDELVSLPQMMQNISTIKGLHIEDSTNLPSSSSSRLALHRLAEIEALVITYKSGSLQYLIYTSKLRSLHIYNCPNVGSLPEGLQYLDTLKYLEVKDCPLLEVRCRREEGEDWYKISRVPNIKIGRLTYEKDKDWSTYL